MKINVYSIYDDKSERFFIPFFQLTDNEAIRTVGFLCADNTTDYYKVCSDISLYRIGVFDDSNGNMVPCKPVPIIRGVEARSACIKVMQAMTMEFPDEQG